MKIHAGNLAIATVAGFLLIYGLDYVINCIILKDAYSGISHLWRPIEEMQKLGIYSVFGQLVLAVSAALIFVHGYEGKGAEEGIKFGFYLGSIFAAFALCSYSHMPIEIGLMFAWIAAGYIKAIMLGVTFAILYKKK